MYKYVLKRLLMLIPVIIGVSFLVFFIMSLSPGDPARTILGETAPIEAVEALREELAAAQAERDKLPVSDWAQAGLEQAKAAGLTDGTRPQGWCTRQEAALMLLAQRSN